LYFKFKPKQQGLKDVPAGVGLAVNTLKLGKPSKWGSEQHMEGDKRI